MSPGGFRNPMGGWGGSSKHNGEGELDGAGGG